MAYQDINIGTTPNDGTGESVRSGFSKVKAMFTELYNYITAFLSVKNATIVGKDSNGNFVQTPLTLNKIWVGNSLNLPAEKDYYQIQYYDATVGTGGDFAKIQLAVAAGKYRLKQVGAITETGSFSINGEFELQGNGSIIALGNNKITLSASHKIHDCYFTNNYSSGTDYSQNTSITVNLDTGIKKAQSQIYNNYFEPLGSAISIFIYLAGANTYNNVKIEGNKYVSVSGANLFAAVSDNVSNGSNIIITQNKITSSGTGALTMPIATVYVNAQHKVKVTDNTITGGSSLSIGAWIFNSASFRDNKVLSNGIIRFTNISSEVQTIKGNHFTLANIEFAANSPTEIINFSENSVGGTTNISSKVHGENNYFAGAVTMNGTYSVMKSCRCSGVCTKLPLESLPTIVAFFTLDNSIITLDTINF